MGTCSDVVIFPHARTCERDWLRITYRRSHQTVLSLHRSLSLPGPLNLETATAKIDLLRVISRALVRSEQRYEIHQGSVAIQNSVRLQLACKRTAWLHERPGRGAWTMPSSISTVVSDKHRGPRVLAAGCFRWSAFLCSSCFEVQNQLK